MEESIGENLQDLESGRVPRYNKMSNWTLSKLKTFALQMTPLENENASHRLEENINISHLTKNLCIKSIKRILKSQQ